MPYNDIDGTFINAHLSWWTNGFYPGLLWICYMSCNEDIFKELLTHFKKDSSSGDKQKDSTNLLNELLMMDEQRFRSKREEYMNQQKIITKKKQQYLSRSVILKKMRKIMQKKMVY